MSVNCILQGQGKWHPPMSNPNLLDNWYFADPINQRGQTEYTDNDGYTIDRWQRTGNASGLVQIYDDGILYSGTGNGNLIQIVEGNFSGQKLTFSVMIVQQASNMAIAIRNLDWIPFAWLEIPEPIQPGVYSVTAQVPFEYTGNLRVTLCARSGQEGAAHQCKLQAAKLELGTQQTLAHQDKDGNWVLNDPPPNKALELAKCQRYQWIPKGSVFWLYKCEDGVNRLTIHFPVTMRRTPSVAYTTYGAENIVSEMGTPSSISFYAVTPLESKTPSIMDFIVDANL